jgi:outer membrane protein assembly factor BamA
VIKLKNTYIKIALFIISTVLLKSCSVSQNLKPNELILKSNKIYINESKFSTDSLMPLIIQKKNNYILGIPIGAKLYQSGNKNSDSLINLWLNKKENREKKLNTIFSKKQVSQIKKYVKDFNNWKTRNGEKLEIVDSLKTIFSVENIKSFYRNRGYFDSKVKSEVVVDKNQKNYGNVIYNVNLGNRYLLDSIKLNIKSKLLDSIFNSKKEKSLLVMGDPFTTSIFEKERNRIDKLFKDSGIYNFQISAISFKVNLDTISANFRIPVEILIDDKKNNDYKIHKIEKININIVNEDLDNELEFIENFNGIDFYSNDILNYKTKILTELISIKINSNYSDEARTNTIKKLNDFDNFQYPSISFNYLNNSNNRLEVDVFLVPQKKYSLSFGLDLKHSNIEDIGIAFETSFNNRNIFMGGEKLELTSRGTIGKSSNTTISEYGFDLRLKFPRFFSPEKFKILRDKPATFLNLGVSNQNNIGLDRQNFRLNLNYDWIDSKKRRKNLSLINIELVNNKNRLNYFNIYTNSYEKINQIALDNNANSKYFDSNNELIIPSGIDSYIEDVILNPDLLNENDFNNLNYINDRRNRLTANNLIVGSSYSIIKRPIENVFNKDFSEFKFKVELAGNLTNLLANEFKVSQNELGQNKILGLAYSQFVKTEISYIKHWKMGLKSKLAIRSFFGIAAPFGNSKNIPFSKSFFAGGSNDNRAWEVYRLGPGSSGALSEFNEANMKIALNVEYRFNLVGKLDGAIFSDFGNIWNVFDDTKDDKRTFNNLNDLNEIAIGSGFGLRYNLGYFVLRLDTGFKTYNPVLENKERWFSDFNFKNAVFNIGLNYPF